MNNTLTPHALFSSPQLLDNLDDALFLLDPQGAAIPGNTAGRAVLAHAGGAVRKLADFFFLELSLGDIFLKKDATPIQLRKLNVGDHAYVVRGFFNGDDLILILSEITDLKRMAQDLSLQLTQVLRFKIAMQFLADGIVLTDVFERIVFMNKAMCELLAARNAGADLDNLAKLENLFGHLPTTEAPVWVSDEHEEGTAKPADGMRLVIEKRALFLSDNKLHGFMLRFSRETESAQHADVADHGMKKDASVGSATWLPRTSKPETVRPQPSNRKQLGRAALRDFVGQSKAVLQIKEIIKKVASSSSTVLLQSESGTGKELLARSLHELSDRANGPFIKLNCASLPESLLEAEVFGYDSGAFTGAKKSGNPGLFEQAHTGTIFLDELGEMSLPLQAKLLRIIQEREVQRIGGQALKRLDVRVVCATNRNLLYLVKEGQFRSDLLFRLNVVSITIPPLRDRKSDIKSLIIHFLRECSQTFKKNVSGVSKDVYYHFMNYDWPGNVRELGNIIEYAFNIIDGGTIECKHLPQYFLESSSDIRIHSEKFNNIISEYSRKVVMSTLERYNGNKIAACGALGISRSKLYRIISG
ncbi:MAG: sigma 54-interacting transcriptional regulator [Desulfovibrio sp.]|uniref:sigma 54-interacting transcriptional regulator n=1 Tax=Desulfovibrio sp. TaxID=885 RepID=UPI002A35D1A9|nr:sigma 54-interacting transcriptional regulator [Desulfovibrio sp.]MDY0260256.1 sigma 54-interacting transcriptional regulator [Desulfovibrio sp.]